MVSSIIFPLTCYLIVCYVFAGKKGSQYCPWCRASLPVAAGTQNSEIACGLGQLAAQRFQAGLQLLQLVQAAAGGAEYCRWDGLGLLAQAAAGIGQADDHLAFVAGAALAADQLTGFQP